MKPLLTAVFFFSSLVVFCHANVDARWQTFKVLHNRSFKRASDEDLRKDIFIKTDQLIESYNSRDLPFVLDHNELSDRTSREINALMGTDISHQAVEESYVQLDRLPVAEDRANPSSLDLRKDNCSGPVKDQKSCGSCWAFSAIYPLEFSSCKKKGLGKYVALSEQQLVDCDTQNGGCNGGWPSNGWGYIKNAGGSVTQASYPYLAKRTTCSFKSNNVGAKVAAYGSIGKSAASMVNALNQLGPLSVALYANSAFNSYKSGVFTDKACDGKGVNHGVNVVGYGTDPASNLDFWIVRNSWNARWGDGGYIKMQRGVNKCQIESFPAAVIAV